MISTQNLELQIGARTLVQPTSFQIAKGDRIGLVGRNGAGKTTLTSVLAGLRPPSGGVVKNLGSVGYLPQDNRDAEPRISALTHILQARNLANLQQRLTQTELDMASTDIAVQTRALKRYDRIEAEFVAAGGYGAAADAHQVARNLGLTQTQLEQPLFTLSGGQRRRVELARILFSQAEILLLDEPTNHLDVDSVKWLRDFLKSYDGGVLLISHDVELLRGTVNKIFHLDATRSELEIYALGWDAYLKQREVDQKRRVKQFQNAQVKATALLAQAEKMRAKATKAVAAQNMIRRAEEMMAEVADVRAAERVAAIRFPDPVACGKTPLMATGLTKYYGSLEVFTGVSLAIDRGSRVVVLGLNGAGKTTLLRLLAGEEEPDAGQLEPGHGLKIGYFAQEHETLDLEATVAENLRAQGSALNDTEIRNILGSFLFSGDDADKPAGVLSGGEKTRLALAILVVSGANVLLLDEPTNNLDPLSRAEILRALETYTGAIVLVTHDVGAVDALQPDRVLLLPDGDEDLWNDSYRELIELS